MNLVRRSAEARLHRQPDLFLCHSSRDKTFVRKLAEDLTFCEIDVWLDEWEIQIGESLYDRITDALERSRFTGIVVGDNFADSNWARDELKQALARERRSRPGSVLPLVCGNGQIPAFLEDKVFADFRSDYYGAVVRLAAALHGVSRLRAEEAVRRKCPAGIGAVIEALRYCGVEPYIVLGEDDFAEIKATGHVEVIGDRVRFDPERVRSSDVSPRVQNLMTRLIDEVWAD